LTKNSISAIDFFKKERIFANEQCIILIYVLLLLNLQLTYY